MVYKSVRASRCFDINDKIRGNLVELAEAGRILENTPEQFLASLDRATAQVVAVQVQEVEGEIGKSLRPMLGPSRAISRPNESSSPKGARNKRRAIVPAPADQPYCKKKTANHKTGSTLYVGAPAGTGRVLAILLTGMDPNANECFLPRLRMVPAAANIPP